MQSDNTNENNRQGGKPDEKTTAADFQKLPHKYRPKAGCDQRDPICRIGG